MRLTVVTLFSTTILAATAFGQSMISAHSGVVQYVEGDVTISDKPVEMKFGHFPEVKPDQVLSTQEGRAEVLLSPGSFLRLSENTEVRMISNQLSDTRFELLKGEILVETVDGTKDKAAAMVRGNAITVTYKESTTTLNKPGLYEFKAGPGRLRVFEGEAVVKAGSELLTLKKGKEAALEGTLTADKFDPKTGDDLTRWSSRRSGYIATANVASANTMSTGGSSAYSGFYSGMGSGYGGWAFNPIFGMYTYMPFGGMAYSPFGYSYWSPYMFSQYYLPYYGSGYYAGNGFNNGLTRTVNTGGNSSVVGATRSQTGPIGIHGAFVSSGNRGIGGGSIASGGGSSPAAFARSASAGSSSGFSGASASRGASAGSGGGGGGARSSGGGGGGGRR